MNFISRSVINVTLIILSSTYSLSAGAAFDFTFTLDTDDWGYTQGVVTGDSITFTFADGTDFAEIETADLVGYSFDLTGAGGPGRFTSIFTLPDFGLPTVGQSSIVNAFSFDGASGELVLLDVYSLNLAAGTDSVVASIQPATFLMEWQIRVTDIEDWFHFVTLKDFVGPQGMVGTSPDAHLLLDQDPDPSNDVPEPSIIALFALGLVALGFARRRQS